ncbi:MAG: PDZ domain-containing protein [bacterium]
MSIIFSGLNGAKRRIIFLTTIVVLCFLAGMVGSYFAASFGYVIFGLDTVEEVTPDYNAKANVIIREAKNVVVMQNEQVKQIASTYQSSSLLIVQKNSKSDVFGAKYYNLNKPFAEALPMTSDGWLISNLRGKFKKDTFVPADYLLFDDNKKSYVIDKFIKDEKNGLYFLHIKTTDLKINKIIGITDDIIGSPVIAPNHDISILTANITNVGTKREISYSDEIVSDINLDRKIDQNYSVIYMFSGDLMGFVNQDGKIISADFLGSIVSSLLKFGSIKQTSLGLYCQDLRNLVPVDGKDGQEGCIVNNIGGPAITKLSPAEKFGIKAGDIILEINQEPLITSIPVALSRFLPGDKITLSVLRSGKTVNMDIVLAEKK